jgi:hypothetical protein
MIRSRPITLRPPRAVVACLAALLAVLATMAGPAGAHADGWAGNLDDNPGAWQIWWDCHPAQNPCPASGQINPDPGEDGTGMALNFQGGPSYVGMYNYDTLPADTSANTFQVSYDFIFFDWDLPAIQALEFTMDQFVSGQRYEWALQWERLGPNGAPQWRIWSGSSWDPFGMPQSVDPDVWHQIQINGRILGGQVHYDSFTFDGTTTGLGQDYAPHGWPNGDQMVAAVQLDSDSAADPYNLYLDNVSLSWASDPGTLKRQQIHHQQRMQHQPARH